MDRLKKKRKTDFNDNAKPGENLLIPEITDPPEKILVRREMFQFPEEISSNFSYKKFLNLSNAQNKNSAFTTYMKSYRELNRERKEFRKYLLTAIKGENYHPDGNFERPPDKQDLLRYYYYINHGVSTVHIPPIANSWIQNVLRKLANKFTLRTALLDNLIEQIKEEYVWTIKKSVIDFALQNPEEEYKLNLTKAEKRFKEEVTIKCSERFQRNKSFIEDYLFTVHPLVLKIRDVWHIQYGKLVMLNIEQLQTSTALDLLEAESQINNQIENFNKLLHESWIPSICNIILKACRKKNHVNIAERKKLKFYNAVYMLMTLQIQSSCLITIDKFTKLLCSITERPKFVVSVMYEDKRIKIEPNYKRFNRAFADTYGMIINSVYNIPSVECKLRFQDEYRHADYLKPVILNEIIVDCVEAVKDVLQNEWVCPELKIQDFDNYLYLINGKASDELFQFLLKGQEFETYTNMVSYYHHLRYEISLTLMRTTSIGMFEIRRENFISVLIQKATSVRDELLRKIADDCRTLCNKLNSEFETINVTVLQPPGNTAELVKLKEYCLELGTRVLFEMEDRLRSAMNYIVFLGEYTLFSKHQIKENAIPFLWYKGIESIFEKNRSLVEEKTSEFQKLLKKKIEQFHSSLSHYMKEVEEFREYRDVEELHKYLKKAQTLSKKLDLASQKIGEFNEEEITFGWPNSRYPKKDEIAAKLAPYKDLYENCSDYKNKYYTWTQNRIGTFQPTIVETEVQTFYKNIIDLNKQFSQIPAPYALTLLIRQDIELFQSYLPLVKTLGNPDLKERHWEKVSEVIGFPLRVNEELTLAKIFDYGLEEYVPKFRLISDSATKENILEKELNGMINEWKDLRFKITQFRETDTYILSSVDEIQILLDDHIVKTQMMKNSPYIKPFETTIHSWEDKLIRLQEIIDCWFDVQRTWIYLQPVFAVPDIQQQMPEEARRFSAMDKIWKEIMKTISSNTEAMVVIEIEKLLERFNKCNTLLDMVQRGLNGYLEIKRNVFPRFFFLSNEEILKIISKASDLIRIQPHLNKCFLGIDGLTFTEDSEIYSVKSKSGEELILSSLVDTRSSHGQVEKWLVQLETVIKNSVHRYITDLKTNCVDPYDYVKTSNSVQQIALVVRQLIFDETITNALNDGETFKTIIENHQRELSKLIATLQKSTLTKRDRNIFGCFLVMDLYMADVLNSCIKQDTNEMINFQWLSKLRYRIEDGRVSVSIMNRTVPYANEYLGDVTRLLITPQTERCMRSIFLAIKYGFHTCITGAAGLGKTELVNDISKIIGKSCYIFNCCTGTKCSLLEKFFKGLVSFGPILCFTNLDRLDARTLTTFAYYSMNVYQAIKRKLGKVVFTSGDYKLESSCMTFSTICTSPADLKRTGLPNTMKLFTRYINVKDVDYVQIIRGALYRFGFATSETLSEKIVSALTECSRLLSTSLCLSFNLRTVRTILNHAVKIKIERQGLREDEIIYRTLSVLYEPTLTIDQVVIFRRILSRVFLHTESIMADFDSYDDVIRNICEKRNVQCDQFLIEKVVQLYEMMGSYTGIVIVGDASQGKTTIAETLIDFIPIYTRSVDISNVHTVVINPKTLLSEELYGYQDNITWEWNDGVFSSYYRKFIKIRETDRKLLIFDGPVDCFWTDHLNAVLNDDGKLHLSSGETINIAINTNLIFETDDISHVSPGLIARCGIVYVTTTCSMWQNVLHSWLNTLPSLISDENRSLLKSMSFRFCRLLLHVFTNVIPDRFIYPSSACCMVKSLTNIYDCFMNDFQDPQYYETLSDIDVRAQLEGIFFFSCIWSFGVLLTEDGKCLFNILFRSLMSRDFSEEVRLKYNLPEEFCHSPQKCYVFVIPEYGTVFDYQFLKEGKGKWKLWSEAALTVTPIPRDLEFGQIIVPTRTSVRNSFLLSLLIPHGKPVLFVGSTATGKTVDIKDFLRTKLDVAVYKTIYLNFSSSTTANLLQSFVLDKLDKRKRGVYGPPLGMKYILFVDDISFSFQDEFGTRSSLELLRQLIERQEWYDSKSRLPIKIVDLQIIAAVTDDVKNRHTLPARFTRHFNIITTDIFDDEILKSISNKIMLWHLDTKGFSKEFDPCIDQIVDATLEIYKSCQARLLPVPSKLHYDFTVRHFFQVIQGVILSVPEAIEDLTAMKRLWVHEVLRVFHDRLITSDDKNILFDSLRTVSKNCLKEDLNEMLAYLTNDKNPAINETSLRKLLFCDFINPKADIKNYSEVQDIDSLQSVVEGYLIEYNNMTKKPMRLILFDYVIEHLVRICRILKQPQGHPILIGDSGIGRQSMAKLATHICEYELFQIEITNRYGINDWRADLKSVLLSAYTEQHAALLLTDSQIIDDTMVEDICNLMLVGEIRNIFTPEDKKEIFEKMEMIDSQRDKNLQTDGSQEALFDLFIERVYKQVHVIFIFNSCSDTFHKYVRKFPTLAKCCVLDWCQSWPSNVLRSASIAVLHELFQFEEREIYISILMYFYETVQDLSNELDRNYSCVIYTSPKSFIKLVQSFKHLFTTLKSTGKYFLLKFLMTILNHIRLAYTSIYPVIDVMNIEYKKVNLSRILNNKRKYQTALQQLSFAEEQIPLLSKEHAALQPAVVEKRLQVEHAEVAVESEKEQETEVEVSLNSLRTIHNVNEKKLRSIKDTYAEKLEQVQTYWETTTESLRSITPADLNTLRSMKNPPKCVKLVIDALAIVKEIKSDKTGDLNNTGKTTDDYWKPTIRLLADAKFVDNLITFDKDNVPFKLMKMLEEKIFAHVEFVEDKIKSSSLVAEAIYKWIIALHKYDSVVNPESTERLIVLTAEEKISQSKSDIAQKETELKNIQEKRRSMEDMYEKVKMECSSLEKKEQSCYLKKERAEELVRILNGAKISWPKKLAENEMKQTNLAGDALVGSAIITFLGPYDLQRRNDMIWRWSEKVRSYNVHVSDNFSISTVLSDLVDMKKEHSCSLPCEQSFIEAACIARLSQNWSFIIDSQRVMNRWIKASNKNDLIVLKTEGDYLRCLENAVHAGATVLLEDISDDLDATLYPLLEKQVFKTLSGTFIKIGDATVEYNQNFRLFLTTTSAVIKLQPELFDKLCVINCDLTKNCLQLFLKNTIVAKNKPDVDTEICQLNNQNNRMEIIINEEEYKILELLSSSECILESETGVPAITVSQSLIDETSSQLSSLLSSEHSLKSTLGEYEEVANQFSIMYFVLESMKNIRTAYVFSYDWFINIIEISINNSTLLEDMVRVFMSSLYKAANKIFFDKDSLLFLLLMAVNLKRSQNTINTEEWKFFLKFDIKEGEIIPSPLSWLSDASWTLLNMLTSFNNYEKLPDDIKHNAEVWKKIVRNISENNLPMPWNKSLNNFQKMILHKCLLPEDTEIAVLNFIKSEINIDIREEISGLDMMSIYNDSSCTAPVFFLLFDETDPTEQILNFAVDMGINYDKCVIHNLAVESNEIDALTEVMGKALKSGSWLILLNWEQISDHVIMLNKIYDNLLQSGVHPDFRMWVILSIENCNNLFSRLRSGIRVKWNLPQNIKNRLHRLYTSEPVSDSKFFNQIHSHEVKRIIFIMCVFHCFIQEKRSTSNNDFNQFYIFNDHDLSVALQEICQYVKEHNVITDKIFRRIVRYSYDGQVSDQHDIQYIDEFLQELYYLKSSTDDHHLTYKDGAFLLPHSLDYSKHLYVIENLPYYLPSELFGVGKSVDIWKGINHSKMLLSRIMSIENTFEKQRIFYHNADKYLTIIESVLGIVPFDIVNVNTLINDDIGKDALMTILVDEMFSTVQLIKRIRDDLILMYDSIKGKLVMTLDTEEKLNRLSMFCNHPTKKYDINEVIQNVTNKYYLLKKIITEKKIPLTFDLSIFNSTEMLFMAMKAEFSWSNEVPICNVELIMSVFPSTNCVENSSKNEIYFKGVTLENAYWNFELNQLDECKNKCLGFDLPLIRLCAGTLPNAHDKNTYSCPFYEVREDQTDDRICNDSYNFITTVQVRTAKSAHCQILSGTKLICKMCTMQF